MTKSEQLSQPYFRPAIVAHLEMAAAVHAPDVRDAGESFGPCRSGVSCYSGVAKGDFLAHGQSKNSARHLPCRWNAGVSLCEKQELNKRASSKKLALGIRLPSCGGQLHVPWSRLCRWASFGSSAANSLLTFDSICVLLANIKRLGRFCKPFRFFF